MKIISIITSLFLATAAAAAKDDHDADRKLHFMGGGTRGGRGGFPGGPPRGGGGRPPHGFHGMVGDTELTCDDNCITCDLRMGFGEVQSDGGYRLCRKSPFDDTKWHNICINSTAPIMGFEDDKFGCCEEDGTLMDACPNECSGCPCQQLDYDGSTVMYEGSDMKMTRKHWFGGTAVVTKCVMDEFTVDAQLKGGECCPE